MAAAVAKHPTRFVGFFMVNAAAPDAIPRTHARALTTQRLRGLCLFPAMHHDAARRRSRDRRSIEAAAGPATRRSSSTAARCRSASGAKLGLPSPFDLRLGDPLGVARLALAFPAVPFIIPHFGAGLLREALMAADTCPNIYLDTSSSNGWIRYHAGPDARTTSSAPRWPSSGRRDYSSAPTRRSFPRGWQRGVYEEQHAALDHAGVAAADQDAIFGGTSIDCFRSGRSVDLADRRTFRLVGGTMKAIVVREFGGPDVMKLEDVPVPAPGPGQIAHSRRAPSA